MKSRKRIFSIVLMVSMFLSTFSFAPGVAAETQEFDTSQETIQENSFSVTQKGQEPAAEKADLSYQITTDSNIKEGGTVTVDRQTVKDGQTVTYTVTPSKGYKTVSIKIGTIAVNPIQPYDTTSGIFTPAGDTIVSVVFEKRNTYNITTSVNSTARGTITATDAVTEGGEITVTAKAKNGYYLSDLLVDGKSVGEKYSYTFDSVQGNHTVKAVFSKQIKIMLDAGHFGNYNRSPVYTSYYESRMAWTLHNYLKEALSDYNGFYIGVTRSSLAKDMSVYSRGTASKGYNLFLSLHSNSSSSRSTDYPLIITQKGNTGDKLAKNLGAAIEDTMNTKQAYKVWQRLNSDGKTEYYGVLRGSKSVGTKGMIIEHSFHTNLAATKWLSSNANLKKMAKAEAKVLADYYNLKKKDSVSSDSKEDTIMEDVKPATDDTVKTEAATVKSTQKIKVTVSALNMRKSYSTSSKSMGKAKKNTIYQLKAKTKDGTWGQLKVNGYWIYLKGYTKPVTSASAATVKSTQKVKVTVSELNMRKSYSTSSKSMGKAKKNTVYQLKAKTKDGAWGQLKTNGYWIYLKGYTKTV